MVLLLISNLRRFKFFALIASFIVILSLCAVVVTNIGTATADDDSIEKRIQRIEDEKQIRDLIVQYGQYLDTLDFAGFSQLFAREGEWSGLLGEFTTVKGPNMIRSAMEEAFAERTYDPDRVTNIHLTSNIKLDINDNQATGYSRWTVLSRNGSDEPYVRLSGHYDDVYIREDGRWKFLSRVARREVP